MSFITCEVTIRKSVSAFPSPWKSKLHRVWNTAEASNGFDVQRMAIARSASIVIWLRRRPRLSWGNHLAARNHPVPVGFFRINRMCHELGLYDGLAIWGFMALRIEAGRQTWSEALWFSDIIKKSKGKKKFSTLRNSCGNEKVNILKTYSIYL